MMIILLFLISICILLFSIRYKNNKLGLYFILILFVVLITFRDINLVPDTQAYNYIYDNSFLNKIERIRDAGLRGIEIGYIYYLRLFKKINFSYREFLFFNTLIMILIWLKTTKRILTNPMIAFFIFFPFYGLFYFSVTIRAGLANLLAYVITIIYLKKNNKFIYYIGIFISSLIHTTMVIYFIFPLVYKFFIKIKKRYIYWFIILCFFISYFKLGFLISDKILDFLLSKIGSYYPKIIRYTKGYAEDVLISYNISLRLLKNQILAFYFIKLKNKIKISKYKIYNYFLMMYIIGIFLNSFFSYMKFNSSRLGDVLIFYEFVLLGLLYENTNKKLKLTVLMIIILNSIIMLFFLINWLPVFRGVFIKI